MFRPVPEVKNLAVALINRSCIGTERKTLKCIMRLGVFFLFQRGGETDLRKLDVRKSWRRGIYHQRNENEYQEIQERQSEKQKVQLEVSILVICQELFEEDFDMFFRKKGNFNRPSVYFTYNRMSVRLNIIFGVQLFAGVQLVFDQQSKNESY